MALLPSPSPSTVTHLPWSPSSRPFQVFPQSQIIPKPHILPQDTDPIRTATTNVSWTSSISRLSRGGQLAEAVEELTRMRLSGLEPNHIVFITILSSIAAFQRKFQYLGDLIHGYVCKLGMDRRDVIVGTALLEMYAKLGFVEKARVVFDSLEVKNHITWNTILDGYMRNGKIDKAVNLFDEMPSRDLVSWTAMINGFVKRGYHEEALDWFREMQKSNVEPDYVTVIAVLSACANLGARNIGLWVHRFLLNQHYRHNVKLQNSLVDMYSRCGCIELAREVFSSMPIRTIVSWNSIIGGLALNGYAEEALHCFEDMQRLGFKPDAITFTGALTACSHSGLINKGLEYFESMNKFHRIIPRVEHYGCLVDLYSRAGRLEEALHVIQTMPVKPNVVLLGSLLAACRTHGNHIRLAERVVEWLRESGREVDSNLVTLANMYASEGMWDGASRVRRKMKALGLRKTPGFSAVEVRSDVHEFVSGDKAHTETEGIYRILDLIAWDSGFGDCVDGVVEDENIYK